MTSQKHLEQLQAAVSPHIESVSLLGKGCSSFLFIENKGRAIEASRHENQWWLEFWDNQEDDDAAPVKECTLGTNEEAFAAIVEWLN